MGPLDRDRGRFKFDLDRDRIWGGGEVEKEGGGIVNKCFIFPKSINEMDRSFEHAIMTGPLFLVGGSDSLALVLFGGLDEFVECEEEEDNEKQLKLDEGAGMMLVICIEWHGINVYNS